ncbi:MAG: DUF2155 domain-containing protein [Alphaproteobacteria bacterium]|nr:DUF2155 domain-containing protein [Alphaproteobacteria bacterium]
MADVPHRPANRSYPRGLEGRSNGSDYPRHALTRLGPLAFAVLLPSMAVAAEPAALLRGLDKITARITTFEAPIGQEVRFGTLRIVARACRKRPPEEPPEVAVFVEIDEVRPGEDRRLTLFSGWMFASSPALSALEHPVYDVWTIDCSTSAADSLLPPSEKSTGRDSAASRRE